MNSTPIYDVFVSYSWRDKGAVEELARALKERGLKLFLDRWYLVPGQPWPQALENALSSCRAVAVILGPEGMGPWQQRETYLALDRQSRENTFPVIPVLLPGGEPALGFLAQNTWVDLRDPQFATVEIDTLTRAIKGGSSGGDRADAIAEQICPYRGLRAFREEDAPLFFGREEVINCLKQSVDKNAFVALVGPSGSGKSSIARAGLIPLLRRQTDQIWDVVVLTPRDRPLRSLSAALLPLLEPDMAETQRLIEIGELERALLAGGLKLRDIVARVLEKQRGTDRLLILVDQWEELYTAGISDGESGSFTDALLEVAATESATVVLTLRADFFGHLLARRDIGDRLQGAVVHLGPMAIEEIEQAITKPAESVALGFEHGLVQAILNDVSREPGNLPLLEFALTQLWEDRRNGLMLHEAYEGMGRVSGAIVQKAESIISTFLPGENVAVKDIFIRLVQPGEGTGDTRRRAGLAEIPESYRNIVNRLADERLIVTGHDETSGEEVIELSHEALISGWPRYQQWIQESRAFLDWRLRLENMQKAWEESHEDDGGLLRGAILTEAEEKLATFQSQLTTREQHYVKRSIAQRERESIRERGRIRNLRLLASAMSVMAIAAGIAGWGFYQSEKVAKRAEQVAEKEASAALWERSRAEALLQESDVVRQQAQRTQSLFLADRSRQELEVGHVDTATLLALEALPKELASPDRPYMPLAEVRLYQALSQNPIQAPSLTLRGHEAEVMDAAFSPDGLQVATASSDNTAKIWDAATGEVIATLSGHGDEVFHVSFSDDGQRILTASRNGRARVWHSVSHQSLATLEGHSGRLNSAELSPDGLKVLTAGDDGTVRIWQSLTGEQLNSWRWGYSDFSQSATFAPRGERIAAAFDKSGVSYEPNAVEMRDSETGDLLARWREWGWTYHLAFNDTGEYLASTHGGGRIRIWDARVDETIINVSQDITEPLALLEGHEETAYTVRFKGNYILSGSADNTARLWHWDGRTASPRMVLRGHQDAIMDIRFDPAGNYAVSASKDETARVWKLSSDEAGEIVNTLLGGHGGAVYSASFAPDGSRVVTAAADASARIYEVAPPKEQIIDIMTAASHRQVIGDTAISKDGSVLVFDIANQATLWLWDLQKGGMIRRLENDGLAIDGVTIDPTGTYVAACLSGNSGRVWRVDNGELILKPPCQSQLHFSADGQRLSTISAGDAVYVINLSTLEAIGSIKPTLPDSGVSDSDDLLQPWGLTAIMSSDGHKISTSAFFKQGSNVIYTNIELWDVDAGTLVKRLGDEKRHNPVMAFSPDGNYLVTESDGNEFKLWSAENGALLASLQGHENRAEQITFSPDSQRVATLSHDATRVWAIPSGELIADLGDHSGNQNKVVFRHDGKRIATVSNDRSARVWDAATGELLEVFEGHDGDVVDVGFRAEDGALITVSQDDTCRIRPLLPSGQKLIDLGRRLVPRGLNANERSRSFLGE